MKNERLRTAMVRAKYTPESLAEACGVDPKTVRRWLTGRIPYARHRSLVSSLIEIEEEYLWPTAIDHQLQVTGAAEIAGAWAHRADVPMPLWRELVSHTKHHLDISGYAIHFLPEQFPDFLDVLVNKASSGCQIRITLCDPDCSHTAERDALENLGGTLAGHIRSTLRQLTPQPPVPGLEIALHDQHLYSTIYRFDDEMLLSTHLIGQHGYQHPVWYLRRLGRTGLFERYLGEFERVWNGASPLTATG